MTPDKHQNIGTTNSEIRGASIPAGTVPIDEGMMRKANHLQRFGSAVATEIGSETLHPRILAVHTIMSLLPFPTGGRIRAALYRLIGFDIGPRTMICDKLNAWGGSHIYSKLRIGADCFISWGCNIDLNGTVTLENHVVIGFGVTIVTASHYMDSSNRRAGNLDIRPVVIGEGAWIAANVLILPGVTIGAGAVVGAGSVVTKDVPPDTLVAGNPARIIRSLPTSISEG